jgi:aminopeptidase C
MIIAIRVYVNYLAIETTIADTTLERETKTAELDFSQNFLVNYEKSEFAQYFLQHENNMLAPQEYIIKFEDNTKKTET